MSRPFRAPFALIAVVTITGNAPSALAAALSQADISVAIKAANPGQDLESIHVISSGPIGARPDAASVAAYSTVITGGNMRDSTFGVFIEKDGRIVQLPNKPEPDGQVDKVIVRHGQIVVHSMSYRPSDPHCCPSQSHTATYVVGADAVTVARRGRS